MLLWRVGSVKIKKWKFFAYFRCNYFSIIWKEQGNSISSEKTFFKHTPCNLTIVFFQIRKQNYLSFNWRHFFFFQRALFCQHVCAITLHMRKFNNNSKKKKKCHVYCVSLFLITCKQNKSYQLKGNACILYIDIDSSDWSLKVGGVEDILYVL